MVKTITRDELAKMLSGGEKFKLVDVLSKESFAKEHIRGAISLPLEEIEKKAGKILNKNDKIVVYCASFECQASTKAAERLLSLGYKDVLDYKGGLKDYNEANLPLEANTEARPVCGACCTC